MQHPQLKSILDDLRQRFTQLYGERLVQLVLYGSQARGDATPESDIDVLVVLRDSVDEYEEIKHVSQTISDLCLEYDGIYVACIFMSAFQYQTLSNVLVKNIQSEGIIF